MGSLAGTEPGAPRKAARLLIVPALLAAVAGLQWAGGAYRAEFSGHPDEAAHYITGLMVRDYVAAGFPDSPLRFAADYYAHYPKVALGHWPPFFYIVQAAWTLLFSPSRVAVLLLMAALTAALGFAVYRCLRRECGEVIAASMALLLVSLPWVQRFSQMVMIEIPLMLLCFGAALAYGRFLDDPAWRPTLLFSGLAVLAIMTHGKGAVLALLPPLAALIAGRLELLRCPRFWFPVLPVALLCGPWHWLSLKWGLNWAGEPSLRFAQRMAARNLLQMGEFCGVCLCLLIAAGLAAKVVIPRLRGRIAGTWAALAALVLGVWVFQTFLVSLWEPRHLMIAIPPLVSLAGGGIHWLAQQLSRAGWKPAWAAAGVLLVLGAGYGREQFRVVSKPSEGYPALVRHLLSLPGVEGAVILVSADAAREGAFIAEVAMNEHRPGHFVLRSTKALASSTWMDENYQMKFRSPAEVAGFLETIPVEVVAVDINQSPPWRPHRGQLIEALRVHPQRWRPIETGREQNASLRLYRRAGPPYRTAAHFRLEVRPGLGRMFYER